MEFFLNFNKASISEKVIKFLDSDISDEGIKKSLARISKGNKLQYMEANVIVELLLKAIEMLPVKSFSELSKNAFINDGIKAWNLAPVTIGDCYIYASAKNTIKKIFKTIPN